MATSLEAFANDPALSALAEEVLTYCLFGYSAASFAALRDPVRFAHYTSAATAMSIIQAEPKDRSMWLRNATEMNDFSEI